MTEIPIQSYCYSTEHQRLVVRYADDSFVVVQPCTYEDYCKWEASHEVYRFKLSVLNGVEKEAA